MSTEADLFAVRDASPAGLHAGGYELLTRIAAGGMGEVFVARKTGSGAFEKRVALKLLLPHLSQEPEFIQRFLDEARIAARMNHPNVVQIFDLGEAEGRYFIAMALVEGVSLSRLLRACRQMKAVLPLPIVRLIATGLCEALAHAHGLQGPEGEDFGTIHRDVNPSNVLISTAGAVLLTDFGIAKAQGNLHATRTGHVMGKYAYMAPEQMRTGQPIDRRVDVYAAALTIYETLTGVSPFRRDTDPETIDAVRSERVPDARRLRPEVSPTMSAALRQGTAPGVDERFDSVAELLENLIDGPVARGSELGQWVQELCPTDLERFRGGPTTPIASPRTRSLLLVDDSHLLGDSHPTVTPSPTPRRKRWVIAAGAVLLATGIGAVMGVDREEPQATVSAPTQAPLGPPPPAPTVMPLPRTEAAAPAQVEAPPPRPIEETVPARSEAPTRAAAVPTPRAEAPSPHPASPPVPMPPIVAPAKRKPTPARPVRSRAPSPKKTVQSAPRMGYVSADASPWASLWIDGREVDLTPISRYPLPVGRQVLVFRNPELGKEVRRTVVIEEGKVVTVSVNLER